jgi:hypothetical protein
MLAVQQICVLWYAVIWCQYSAIPLLAVLAVQYCTSTAVSTHTTGTLSFALHIGTTSDSDKLYSCRSEGMDRLVAKFVYQKQALAAVSEWRRTFEAEVGGIDGKTTSIKGQEK